MKQRKDEEERMGDDWVRGGVGGVGWGRDRQGNFGGERRREKKEKRKRRKGRSERQKSQGLASCSLAVLASWCHVLLLQIPSSYLCGCTSLQLDNQSLFAD